MYTYPAKGTKAANHVTPDVHACLKNPERLPTRKDAAVYAANYFRTTTSGATGLYKMTLLANDNVALCFYGIRGGFKQVWDFGQNKEGAVA